MTRNQRKQIRCMLNADRHQFWPPKQPSCAVTKRGARHEWRRKHWAGRWDYWMKRAVREGLDISGVPKQADERKA